MFDGTHLLPNDSTQGHVPSFIDVALNIIQHINPNMILRPLEMFTQPLSQGSVESIGTS